MATTVLPYSAETFDAAFTDRKSTRLNSSHLVISYAVFCLKKTRHIWLSCPRAPGCPGGSGPCIHPGRYARRGGQRGWHFPGQAGGGFFFFENRGPRAGLLFPPNPAFPA